MTQIEKIKAEIERLQAKTSIGLNKYDAGYENGKAEACGLLLNFINSLQAEPVSEEAILRRAIERYGYCAQINMAMEEMGELIVALQHRLRDRASLNEVCEEVADVQIMMEQLAMIFGKNIVCAYHEAKIQRLEHRLNKEN